MKTIMVVGHKKPDTDSIVSALVLADFLQKAGNKILGFPGFRIKPRKAGPLNKETKFVFKYFKKSPPPLIKSIKNKDVFLVDHNSYEEAAEGLEEANIFGVIDHHFLGGLKTVKQIFYRSELIGSTSTVLAKMFLENHIPIDKKTAGLLLAAILSDTLKFTSPTTTAEDKKIAKILVKISKEDINYLSKKMFEAKSDIRGISSDKLVSKDYKEYKIGRIKFGIGVWETLHPNKVKEIKKDILFSLEKLKKKEKLDLIFFALVDILKKNSELFILTDREKIVAEKAFKSKTKENSLFLPGIISRKKEMVPSLLTFLKKNKGVC